MVGAGSLMVFGLNRLGHRFTLLYLLIFVLTMSGCSSTSVRKERYLDQLHSEELAGIEAYHLTNQVVMRIPRRGRDVYARGRWEELHEGQKTHHYDAGELVIDKRARTLFREHTDSLTPLKILLPEVWEKFLEQLMKRVVPEGANRAALILVQNHELVVFRDEADLLRVITFEERPENVTIVKTINDASFAKSVLVLTEEYLEGRGEGERRFLLATSVEPPFVMVDVEERSTVFFSRGIHPEHQTSGADLAFSLRALDHVLFRSHVIMAIKNPFTVLFRGVAQISDTGATLLNIGVASFDEATVPLNEGPGMDLEEWESRLDEIASAPRYRGSIDFLVGGESFFPALIQSIQGARERIDFRSYIFDTDDYAVKIADLLRARSEDVEVNVMMDSLGSLFAGVNAASSEMPVDFVPPSDIGKYLKLDSDVSVRHAANPWFTGDHCKTLIFDREEAYLGGMNIGREYRYDWHDMMVRLRGPIVMRLVRDYERAWAHSGWLGDFAYLAKTLFFKDRGKGELGEEGMIDIRPLYTKTIRRDIFRSQIEAIQRARSYIYIQNAYLSDDAILQALIDARARGVDVRVILPARNDAGIMDRSNVVTANTMIRAGIKVYVYPGMSHMKVAIYDGWACLGSANFDKLSLRTNQELDIAFSDPAAVDRLKRMVFDVDFAKSSELRAPLSVDWTDYLLELLANQL